MSDQPSEPLQLMIVYQPAEKGWMTAMIPAVPGTITVGRSQQHARENVLDALRERLSTTTDVSGPGVRVEQLEVRLDLARVLDRGHDR